MDTPTTPESQYLTKRNQYLSCVFETVKDYCHSHTRKPNVLIISHRDVGILEGAYQDLYHKAICLFSGEIETVRFAEVDLMVAVAWGMPAGEIKLGVVVDK